MSSICHEIIEDFASSLGLAGLSERPWYFITGKAGPNAVIKIVISPGRSTRGYVLTVARHADTRVIQHEVDVLKHLRQALPTQIADSIPDVLLHSRCAGTEYFAVPFYESCGHWRIVRRLARNRRLRWIERWLTGLASATLQQGLAPEWLEAEYGETLSRIQADPCIAGNVRRGVSESFETVYKNAGRIPSVCCHGDFWVGNILWQRGSRNAVILDWGAARWPGLPAVDLCRYALSNIRSANQITELLTRYCDSISLDPTFVPALYDLYNLFIKTELDLAYATQPDARSDPFSRSLPSRALAHLPTTASTDPRPP